MTNFYVGYSGCKARIYRNGSLNKIISNNSGTTPTPTPTLTPEACNDSDCQTACGNNASPTYYDGGCAPPAGCFGSDVKVKVTYLINGIYRDCCCATN
jgi:hypothetical protein